VVAILFSVTVYAGSMHLNAARQAFGSEPMFLAQLR